MDTTPGVPGLLWADVRQQTTRVALWVVCQGQQHGVLGEGKTAAPGAGKNKRQGMCG